MLSRVARRLVGCVRRDHDDLRENRLETVMVSRLDSEAFVILLPHIDSPEVVSSDFLGSRRAGIIDGLATIVTDQKAVLYVWYDNEYGYSCQVIRVLEEMSGVHAPIFPPILVEALEPVA